MEGSELQSVSREEALAFVDEQLGPPEAWDKSALLRYRLSSDFQSEWKAEVGQWLFAAQRFGFLDAIKKPIFGERDKPSKNPTRDLHDSRHLKWHQRLADALLCHYFTSGAVGWTFEGWETETGGSIDIDLALRAPDNTLVEFQVKVPDRPGKVVGNRYDKCHGKCGNQEQGPYVPCLGDCDKSVVKSVSGAFEQLPKPARSVALVGVFARRQWSLPTHPSCLICQLYGRSRQEPDKQVYLPTESLGRFLLGELNHVSGIVVIDMIPWRNLFADTAGVAYPCTVLLNPNATHPASPKWFPRSKTLVLESGVFRWIGDGAEDYFGLPTGTLLRDPEE